jgi:hypothetical protein
MRTPYPRTSLTSNLLGLAVVALLVAAFIDAALVVVGYAPFTLCMLTPILISLGRTAGLFALVAGVLLWTLSGFTSNTGVALILGGLAVYIGPLLAFSAMGLRCV